MTKRANGRPALTSRRSPTGASSDPALVASTPRYVWLYEILLQDIQSGGYPVGSAFPTEEQLSQRYGVSRHTVREATRKLVDSGLISRRRSTGTTVLATESNKPYVAALGSLKELLDYTDTTRLQILDSKRIKADEALAKQLRSEAGSEWVCLQTHRHLRGSEDAISYTLVYLRPEYEGIEHELQGNHPSIFKLHEQLYQKPVQTVVQQIEATKMPAHAARLLHLKPGAPSLKMLRCYLDENERVMSASVNYYITEKFQLVTTWHR